MLKDFLKKLDILPCNMKKSLKWNGISSTTKPITPQKHIEMYAWWTMAKYFAFLCFFHISLQ